MADGRWPMADGRCEGKIVGVRVARLGQWALAIGIVLWTAALFLVPGALFPVGAFICHQRPERSFFIHGQQLPVCARCTGLYLGAAFAAPMAMIAAAAVATARARWMFAAASLPTLVTWTLEFAGLMHFSNSVRCLAALPLGIAAAWLVFSVLSDAPVLPVPHGSH
jgi:uncharacterized membrane protein